MGDTLLSKNNGKLEIINREVFNDNVLTYNLEIKDNPNYLVGRNKVLVHNGSPSLVEKLQNLISKDYFFYVLMDATGKTLYVGLTTRTIRKRYKEHVAEYLKNLKRGKTKKNWMEKIKGPEEISLNNKKGPFNMNRYEAAVIELHEINKNGGITNKNGGRSTLLNNKTRPISETKFNFIKKHHFWMNPCKFY